MQAEKGQVTVLSSTELHEHYHASIIQELLLDYQLPEKALQVARNALEKKQVSCDSKVAVLAKECLQYCVFGERITLDIVIPNTSPVIRLLNFSFNCTDLASAAEAINDYFALGRFLFFQNSTFYQEYLSQLKYFCMAALEAENRLSFVQLLISEQAMRNLQFTLKDQDIV